MKGIRNLFSKRQERSTAPTSATIRIGSLGDRYTGENVNSPTQAMRIAAVYQCASILSGSMGSLPMRILRRRSDGYYLPDEADVLGVSGVFNHRANKRQTYYDLMSNAVTGMLLQGNAYIYPFYQGGEIAELRLIPPYCCHYNVERNEYELTDTINGLFGTYGANRIIHLRNKSLDGGYTGVSTIQYASRVLSIAGSADEQTLDGFSSKSKIKGLLVGGTPAKPTLGQYAFTEMDKAAKKFSEALRADEDIIPLDGGVQFVPLSLTPADAQLLESRQYSVVDICRFFGVHPDKVFASVGASTNYKASENSQDSFLTDTMLPLITQVEAEFNSKLIPERLADTLRIKMDISALYKTGLRARADYYERMHRIGALTTNEIRKIEGALPVEGGDQAFVTKNLAPIEMLSGE